MDASANRSSPNVLSLICAPIEDGVGVPGTAMGPAALRTAGLIRILQDLGYAVDDLGDLRLGDLKLGELDLRDLKPADRMAEPVPVGAGARNLARVAAWARLLCRATYTAMRSGRIPIVLGGDHSLSIGSVSGIARHCAEIGRELFVLWLDAHADFNTPATSPSGNIHGMSAASLCGEPGFEDIFGDEPHGQIRPRNLYLFGVRAIDRGERELLRARGVHVIDMRLLDEFGASALMRRIIDQVRERNGLIHVSLDVDFLDPQLAPGVGTAVPGGATFREAHLVMEMLHDSRLVGSLDVVELNPFLDERGKSALLLVDLVASLFGRQIVEQPASTDPLSNITGA
jgi:arginase